MKPPGLTAGQTFQLGNAVVRVAMVVGGVE